MYYFIHLVRLLTVALSVIFINETICAPWFVQAGYRDHYDSRVAKRKKRRLSLPGMRRKRRKKTSSTTRKRLRKKKSRYAKPRKASTRRVRRKKKPSRRRSPRQRQTSSRSFWGRLGFSKNRDQDDSPGFLGRLTKTVSNHLGGATSTVTRVIPALAKLPITIPKSYMDAPITDQLVLGDDNLSFTHAISWDRDQGFEQTDATINPPFFGLLSNLALKAVPAKHRRIFEQIKSLTPGQLFQVQFGMLLNNTFVSKKLKPALFPLYVNRLMQKARNTVDMKQTAIQRKAVPHKMALQGPHIYYNELPAFIRNILDRFKIGVPSDQRERMAQFSKSLVAPKLWEIAATAREYKKFSERNTAMKNFIPLIEEKSAQFTDFDKKALLYWLELHAGEWATKTAASDRADLKPTLVSLLDATAQAVSKAKFTPQEVKRVVALKELVERAGYDTVAQQKSDNAGTTQNESLDPIVARALEQQNSRMQKSEHASQASNTSPLSKMAQASFPELKMSNVQKEKLLPAQFIEHSFARYALLNNKHYLSLYPFGSLGPRETRQMIEAILLAYDKDTSDALKHFKQSPDFDEYKQQLNRIDMRLKKIKNRIDRETKIASQPDADQDVLQGLRQESQEIIEQRRLINERIRQVASRHLYTTPEESIQASMAGKEASASGYSAYDRMAQRLRLLNILSSSFSNVFNKMSTAFSLLGQDMSDITQKIEMVSLDKTHPLVTGVLVPEKESEDLEEPGFDHTEQIDLYDQDEGDDDLQQEEYYENDEEYEQDGEDDFMQQQEHDSDQEIYSEDRQYYGEQESDTFGDYTQQDEYEETQDSFEEYDQEYDDYADQDDDFGYGDE